MPYPKCDCSDEGHTKTCWETTIAPYDKAVVSWRREIKLAERAVLHAALAFVGDEHYTTRKTLSDAVIKLRLVKNAAPE